MPSNTNSSPYSFDSFLDFVNLNFTVILLIIVSFVAGFFIGSLWTDNQSLRGNTRQAAAAPTPTPPPLPSGPTAAQLSEIPEVTDEDWSRGASNPVITLVEYSDYDCPFCARFHPTVQAMVDEFPDQVAWVYRHLPLDNIHPNARAKSEIAECVGSLGGEQAFWSFTDLMFEEQGLTVAQSIEAAGRVGVNVSAVQTCYDEGRFAEAVEADVAGATEIGVTGTPGTVIVTADGEYELINGALPEAQVRQLVENYL